MPVNPLIDISITFPLAFLAVAALAMYWRALGRLRPRSRRRLRRANTAIQMVLAAALVYALSGVDEDGQPVRFVVAWTGVLLLAILTVGLAVLDSINNVRVFRRVHREQRRRALEEAGRAVRERRAEGDDPSAADSEP